MSNSNTVTIRGVEIGEGAPKVIVPIVGRTKGEILAAARLLGYVQCDIVEWRADWFEGISDVSGVKDVLKTLRRMLDKTPLLFTFRTKEEGGERSLDTEAYIRLNTDVAGSGLVDLVDVQLLEGDEAVRTVIAGAHANGVRVIYPTMILKRHRTN